MKIGGGYGVKVSKAINLGVTAWCYGIIILIITMLLGEHVPRSVIITNCITPVYPSGYWFVTTFIVFYLSIPFLKAAVTNMSNRALLYVCITGGILIPTYNFVFENVGGTLAYFCYVFILVGFLKKKEMNLFLQHRYKILIISTLLILLPILAGAYIGGCIDGDAILRRLYRIYDTRNVVTLIQGISLFYVFLMIKPFNSKIVNAVSTTALGTYLITENIVIRGDNNNPSILWNKLFHFSDMYGTDSFVLYSFGVIVLVFTAAILIDYFRQLISSKFRYKLELLDKLDNITMKLFEEIENE